MHQKITQRYPESPRNLAAAEEKPWMLIYLASMGARFAVQSRSVSHTKQVILPWAEEEERSSLNQHEPRGTERDPAPTRLPWHHAFSRRNARSPDASCTALDVFPAAHPPEAEIETHHSGADGISTGTEK